MSIAAAPGITVDFTRAVRFLQPYEVSAAETEYTYPYYLTNDKLEQHRIQALGPRFLRIDLQYATPGDPTSAIVCGAAGCNKSISGDTWINTIKALGAQPVVVVPEDSTSDGPNLVRHFNITQHNYIGRWIIGNEPDARGITPAQYTIDFIKIAGAMKQIDPTIETGGPASAGYNAPMFQALLQGAPNLLDFIDFHKYGEGGTYCSVPEATLFNTAAEYGQKLNAIQQLVAKYAPSRVGKIEGEVGEWNLDYGSGCSDARDHEEWNTEWTASVVGHILNAGGISLYYGTKGDGGGLIYDAANSTYNANVDDPLPSYHGLGMYTGEGLFPAFGSVLVSSSTSLPNIEVYASSNPEAIVVINRDPSTAQTTFVRLSGANVMQAAVWSKDATMPAIPPPVHQGSVLISGGGFAYTFPPYSVTRFVLGSSAPPSTPYPIVGGAHGSALTSKTASATFLRRLPHGVYIPAREGALCPAAEIRRGHATCFAEFRLAGRWHLARGSVTDDAGILVASVVYTSSWWRQWRKCNLKRWAVPGILRSNNDCGREAPETDSYLVSHQMWKWTKSGGRVVRMRAGWAFAGHSSFKSIDTFPCKRRGRMFICSNAVGDSFKFTP